LNVPIHDRDPNTVTRGNLAPNLNSDPRFVALMQRLGLPY